MTIGQQMHEAAAIIGSVAMYWFLADDGEHVEGMGNAAMAYHNLFESGMEIIAQVAVYTTEVTMVAGGAPISGNAGEYLQQLSDIAAEIVSGAEQEDAVMTKEMQHLEKCFAL